MCEISRVVSKMYELSKIKTSSHELILIANTRHRTFELNRMRIEFTDETEFFSEEEYTEIYMGIQNLGFYTHSYFNEIDLINDILINKFENKKIIIYNLARNGRGMGKKSLIPAFCDLLGYPYTGSNAFVVSLCRNKHIFTKVLQAHGLLVPKSWIYIGKGQWLANESPSEGIKVIAKPVYESASIGLDDNSLFEYTSKSLHKLDELLQMQNTKTILVQEFISGFEVEVPFFVEQTPIVLDPVGISINNNHYIQDRILTYDISYTDSYDFYSLNDIIPEKSCQHIINIVAKAANILGISNYGRIDFRINSSGKAYITDISTTPYTTNHSSFAYAFKHLGLIYDSIYSTIIGLTLANK